MNESVSLTEAKASIQQPQFTPQSKEISYTDKDIYSWFERVRSKGKKFIIEDEAKELIRITLNDGDFDGFRFIDTMITYQDALANENVNLVDYINAIRFCSYLESSEGNITEAYIKAFYFRDFIKNRVNKPTDSKEYKQITSAASRYRKSPIVVKILTQAEIPLYLMFQGYRYKAINRLAKEMETANSAKDRINAADRLLLHLKAPEGIKIDLDIGIKEESVVDRYKKAIEIMAIKQHEFIDKGADIKRIANTKVMNEVVIENE